MRGLDIIESKIGYVPDVAPQIDLNAIISDAIMNKVGSNFSESSCKTVATFFYIFF